LIENIGALDRETLGRERPLISKDRRAERRLGPEQSLGPQSEPGLTRTGDAGRNGDRDGRCRHQLVCGELL